MVKCFLSNESFNDRIKAWNFNKARNGTLTKAVLKYRVPGGAIDIDFSPDVFWGDDGSFKPQRVILALYQKVQRRSRTAYICGITYHQLQPGEVAVYLEVEDATDPPMHFYYKESHLINWVREHGTSPRTRIQVTLDDIKKEPVPAHNEGYFLPRLEEGHGQFRGPGRGVTQAAHPEPRRLARGRSNAAVSSTQRGTSGLVQWQPRTGNESEHERGVTGLSMLDGSDSEEDESQKQNSGLKFKMIHKMI